MGKNQMSKLLQIACIVYTVSLFLGSIACVVLFPFMESSFIKLDMVECFSGCALALMAFPTAEQVGFITFEKAKWAVPHTSEDCPFFLSLIVIVIIFTGVNAHITFISPPNHLYELL